jgi:predicted outer membrane protein
MGAAASIPAGFDTLSDEDKAVYQEKYQALIDAGKTDDEAIAELQGSAVTGAPEATGISAFILYLNLE